MKSSFRTKCTVCPQFRRNVSVAQDKEFEFQLEPHQNWQFVERFLPPGKKTRTLCSFRHTEQKSKLFAGEQFTIRISVEQSQFNIDIHGARVASFMPSIKMATWAGNVLVVNCGRLKRETNGQSEQSENKSNSTKAGNAICAKSADEDRKARNKTIQILGEIVKPDFTINFLYGALEENPIGINVLKMIFSSFGLNSKLLDKEEKDELTSSIKLVLTAVNGDGNIMELNGATKVNGGGRRSQKRRRKKRDLVLLILLIALLISLCFTVYSYCLHCSNDDSLEQQNADMEMLLVVRQANEIFVKFRYGGDQTDEKGNPKSDHIYIVVDGKEFDFVGDGARSRSASVPPKYSPFDPPLIVPPETVENVDGIFESMRTGHWPPDSHTYAIHSCIDFAYQFVCRLNNGICPEKDRWPRPFAEFDQRWVRRMAHLGRLSVFDFRYRISPQNYELSRDILLPIGHIISNKKQS
ncbi:hypothetical protein niasHT_009053 [Heterodera trifolii]|uniref:Uncharacterized protein n=1 Tax=Heterodera trifolii TaxID=157864 RepID=A0ABD2M241_9BILA